MCLWGARTPHPGDELPSPAALGPHAQPPAAESSQPGPRASCWAGCREEEQEEQEEEEGSISKPWKTTALPGASARPVTPPGLAAGGAHTKPQTGARAPPQSSHTQQGCDPRTVSGKGQGFNPSREQAGWE